MAVVARTYRHKQRMRSCGSRSYIHSAVRASFGRQPCIVFTNTGSQDSPYLHELAREVRRQIECEAVVIRPAEQQQSTLTAAGTYSFDQELQLLPQPEYGSYMVPGATAADCVLCAVDQKVGLLQSLGLSPVLVVVGIHRGPALAADVGLSPAVAAATQAAQLGLPTLASCLATPSQSAPLQPAVEATLQVLHKVVGCLKAGRDSWPAAANMPRAHFPFPEAGRWALGKELQAPQQASGSSTSHWQASDCWALGEDNSWAGKYSSSSSSRQSNHSQTVNSSRPAAAAERILQQAFADGDILLCLNVPPTWQANSTEPRFACTRPGVLWHCYQLEAAASSTAAEDTSRSSWHREEQDVYGRSLPSSSFTTGSSVVSGAFVTQDNTEQVIATGLRRQRRQQQQQQPPGMPASFVIRRGTLLNDHATAGDVDAVFFGKAAVSTLQTWPAGHPLSVRDDVLAAALNEDTSTGLPAWLSNLG